MSDISNYIDEALQRSSDGLTVQELRRELRNRGYAHLTEAKLERMMRDSDRHVLVGHGKWQLKGYEPEPLEEPVPDLDDEAILPCTIHRLLDVLPAYVVFDIETTGTHKGEDRVLQFAALKVVNGQPIEAMNTWVSPGSREIPFAVRQLLDIPADSDREHQVRSAPELRAVLSQFQAFVGDLPTVAHNGTSFDAPFVQALMPDFNYQPFDTLELCALAIPDQDSFSLEALSDEDATRECLASVAGDSDLSFHNALFDCVATHLLLQSCVAKLAEMESATRASLSFLLPELADLLGEPTDAEGLVSGLLPPVTSTPVSPSSTEFSPEGTEIAFRDFVGKSGRAIRPGQLAMVRYVADALFAPSFKMIESPTGTGKSLALAFPAALYSTRTGAKVGITTRTKNLQNQLLGDLEAIKSSGEIDFSYQLIRGRENYACLTALRDYAAIVAAEGNVMSRFCLAAIYSRLCASSNDPNQCGVLTSLEEGWLAHRFGTVFRITLGRIRSRLGVCGDGPCRDYGGCFPGYVMRQAMSANVLVLNHSLWLMATARLPEMQAILVDEAHNLEDAATEAATCEASRDTLRDLMLELLSTDDRGLLPRLRAAGVTTAQPTIPQMLGLARATRQQLDVFGGELERFLSRCGVDLRGEYPVLFRVKTDLRRQEPARWKIVGDALQQLIRVYLEPICRGLDGAAATVRTRDQRLSDEAADLSARLKEQVDYLSRLGTPVGENTVRWIEFSRSDDGSIRFWAVKEAPISVAEILQQFYDKVQSAVFTSATLSTERNDFTFFLSRLGLSDRIGEGDRHALESDLPYDNALFVIPRYLENIPTPSRMEFFASELARELTHLFSFTNGHGMSLMTARKRMEQVFETAGPELEKSGVYLLAQGLSGSAETVTSRLRAQPDGTAVVGLNKLWEGVDVPGPALSILGIEKLPFPAFHQPITQARREAVVEAGESDFFDYLLPWTLIRFKQGFGRLIRGPEDKGVVILFDRRIHHKSYKPAVLGCLPGYCIRPECENSRTEMLRAISEHLPELFVGRDVEELLARLPEDPISAVAALLSQWQLSSPVTESEYAELRKRVMELIKAVFGFDDFRSDEQEEIVKQILCGRDVIGILPTGSGKSFAFQLPALLRKGLTVVVSPLIALMRDQIDKLHGWGIDVAEALFSGQSADEREDAMRRIRDGHTRIFYASPERLRDTRLQKCLADSEVCQLVVDEAHCVSLWGASFRPDYLTIREALPVGNCRIAALTATATPIIEKDIKTRLKMEDPVVVRASADRPELYLGVFNQHSLGWPVNRATDKFHLLTALAKTADAQRDSMIVYVATTVTAEEVARKLAALGYDARFYHGKMTAEERADAQELFMEDVVNILVATKAFGMGIDKPDIRYVVHYDMPGDLESYFQEAERAGRDGRDSYAVLLFHERDIKTQEYFLQNALVEPARLRALADAIDPWLKSEEPLIERELDLEGWEDFEVNLGLYCLQQIGYLVRSADVPVSASVMTYVDHRRALLAADELPQHGELARAVLEHIHLGAYQRETVDMRSLSKALCASLTKLDSVFEALSATDVLRYRPWERGPILRPGPACDRNKIKLPTDVLDYERRRRSKLMEMVSYCSSNRICRRETILRYLGENYTGPCGNCDVCAPMKVLPWSSLRRRDVPNPAQFFDPSFVILQIVEENLARAERDGKPPYGRSTLKHILTGNEFMAVGNEPDPYRRSWRRRRVRSFPQWGLLSSLRSKDREIDESIDALVKNEMIEPVEINDNGFGYSCLRLTAVGKRALETGKVKVG